MTDIKTGRSFPWLIVAAALVVFGLSRRSFQTRADEPKPTKGSPVKPVQQAPPRNPAPSYKWRVSAEGIGPVKVGMSVAQAAAALGEYFAFSDIDTRNDVTCDYAEWPGAPEGVHVVVNRDTVVAVWVSSGQVASEEQLKIGDRADQIEGRYPSVAADKRPNTDHYYGRAFALVIPLTGDSSRRIVYEVADSVIRSFRAGRYRDVLDREPCR
jgi:hypothetical protein